MAARPETQRQGAPLRNCGKGWNEEKNGPKKSPKWAKGVAHFDAAGCLFIKSPELAREIETQMQKDRAGTKRMLCIYRDETEQEKAARLRRPVTDLGKGDDPSQSEAGHPVNMMCPCVEG